MVHAEANAVIMANEPLDGYYIFCYPYSPCIECAKLIIQKGIQWVVYQQNWEEKEGFASDTEQHRFVNNMLAEAGVNRMTVKQL